MDACCTVRLKHVVITFIWRDIEMIVVRFPDLSQPVPLAPFTESNEEAMENKSFQRLLRKLGMRAPANEQVCACMRVIFHCQMKSCDIILCCSPTPNLFCATVVWAELEKSIFRNDTELH